MKRTPLASLVVVGLVGVGQAKADGPALTIYNQDFAVVREILPLELKAGVNDTRCTDITAHLEADSVILRDPAGKHGLRILEQNYCGDPLSQELLLSTYEGKTIDFVVPREGQPPQTVQGKIARSAYVAHQAGLRRYGGDYYMGQSARAWPGGTTNQPIVEVDGKLRFGLPLVEDRDAVGRQGECRAELHHRRNELGSRLQHRVAEGGRRSRDRRVGDDGQPERKEFRECADQADGRRCQQAEP
jgi:hypothetical protein